MQANRRSLTGASAANSIVTGLENSSLYTGDTISITVTAKDLSGNFVTTGGDIFTVKISNLCTKYNDYYCKPNTVTGPLFANVNDVMTDHNNGTYTYSYTLSVVGSVSVQVYLQTQSRVYQDIFSGQNWAGVPTKNCYKSNLDINYLASDICFISPTDNFSSYIIGAIHVAETGNYTFQIRIDDGCEIYIDDILVFLITCCGDHTVTFNVFLNANTYYSLYVKYCQDTGPFYFVLSWSFRSQPLAQNLMQNIFLPSLVFNSPYQITIDETVCGDRKKTGTEACDDGNVVNGDGCSSICKVEDGYVCTGGSPTSKDTCAAGIAYTVKSLNRF